MLLTNAYEIEFPKGFDEFEWEVEAKGWLQGVVVTIERRRYRVTFYDPTRLAQDIADELQEKSVYLESNVLVVPSVTRAHMEKAVETVVKAGGHVDLIPVEESLSTPK
jgi:hypothetical protein